MPYGNAAHYSILNKSLFLPLLLIPMVKDKPIKFSGLASCSYTYIIININNKYEYIYTYLLKISVEHVLMFIKIGYCWTLCSMLYILQQHDCGFKKNSFSQN